MTTAIAPLTVAEVKAKLDTRRARLEELQGDLSAMPATIEGHRESLARALADGAPESAVKKARLAVAEAEAERSGLEAAVNLLREEVEALEAEWRPLHAAELEAEADRLEEAARKAARTAERELKRLAIEFAPTFEALIAANQTREKARREALRAAGAHREDIYYARPKNETPAAWWEPPRDGTWTIGDAWTTYHAMFELARNLANYGRKDSNPNEKAAA